MEEFIPTELPREIILNEENYILLAHAANKLGELNGFSKIIPNQNVFINSLILQEAKDSNAIENIITTHDELFLAQVDETKITPNTKEVQNYENALKTGFELVKNEKLLLNRHILEIQKILVNNNAGFRNQIGTMLKNPQTGEIKHIPPQKNADILRLMTNLERYINENLDNLHPLIRLAIIHYQFEIIHPFYDGNGRAGRILNILYLTHKELLDLPILYLSAYIIQNKNDYYRLLGEVTQKQNWNEWINYILKGIEQTSISTIQRINEIYSAMQNYADILQTKTNFYSKDFVELLFSYPYTKINSLPASRQTASRYLKTCEELGLVEVVKIGSTKYFVNTVLFDILRKPYF